MNILDSLTPQAGETAAAKGALLLAGTEHSEFESLMGQSMQVLGNENLRAIPDKELINISIDGADEDFRMYAATENNGLSSENLQLDSFTELRRDAELPLSSVEYKNMTPVNFGQAEQDLEAGKILQQSQFGKTEQGFVLHSDKSSALAQTAASLYQSESEANQKAIVTNINDSVKLSISESAVMNRQSEQLPGFSNDVVLNDAQKQFTDHLKHLNATEIQINNNHRPEKMSTEPAMPLLESAQLNSLIRSAVKRANSSGREAVSKSIEIENKSEKMEMSLSEKGLTGADLMKEQNKLVIEKEANDQKALSKKLGAIQSDTLLNADNVDKLEAVNPGKTNLSTSVSLSQPRTTDGQIKESVQIIIPESFKLSTTQKTQSIVIRIEPDHLGPARLELTMKDNFLTARLIVETVEARHILESSISQLKEKLAAADIKVENLEITVRNDSNNSHQFDKQQTDLQYQKAFRQINRQGVSMADNEPAALNSLQNTRLQYAGAGGVNLLA